LLFTRDNLVYRLAVSRSEFAEFRDRHGAEGFRTISLALSGPASEPRYTGVMARYPRPFRGQSGLSYGRDELKAKIKQLRSESGLHPYIISATGPSGSAVYAAAFRELSATPVVRPDLSPDAYAEENETQLAAGRILVWVDSFGTPDDIHYCAIWGANPDRVAWNTEALNDSGIVRQQRFDALVSVGARPSRVAMTPAGGLARLFVDSRIGPWDSKASQTRPDLDKELAAQAAEGRYPVCIGAADIGGATRFSTIFATRDDILPRVFRVRGPEPVGLSATDRTRAAAIDTWMETFIRAHNVRGAALAIVEGTRLVYAKGYTFAEEAAHYPDIEPTTLFRMASVSKTFCAVAAWKALADDPAVSRNSTMQSVLNLTTPENDPPADADFAKVRIKHLLESNSGIDQMSVRQSIADVRDGNGTQPLTAPQIACMVAAQSMPGTPGAAGATSYGRTDYFLLGLVAAKLSGAASFDAALKKLVLDPLQMTRTRGSRSRAEDRAADEARHHVAPKLTTGVSVVHDDRRRVPTQYGAENYEVYDGAGGVSSAIVDLARLCAMFSCRIGNPVLSPAMLDAMMSDAVAATAAGTDHGYHGFDAASYDSEADHRVNLRKGGLLPGVRAAFTGTTGERFVVVAYNGDSVEGVGIDLKAEIAAIADTIDWGAGDLFPQFGMPALGMAASGRPRVRASRPRERDVFDVDSAV
jgi:CubicO group peptidase (beta-lactamase class C family)